MRKKNISRLLLLLLTLIFTNQPEKKDKPPEVDFRENGLHRLPSIDYERIRGKEIDKL